MTAAQPIQEGAPAPHARPRAGAVPGNAGETVTRIRFQDINDILSPRSYRTQALDGYEDCYSDIVHYIAYCTHRIWAEKEIGAIYTHYDPAITIITPAGIGNSVEEVVASTLQMLQAFPDRESRLIDVCWSGNAKDGFYTSHLGSSRMTNLGPTIYGPATGKSVRIRHIADCISRDNRIYHEWLIRDNGALVRQLGLDVHEVARRLAAQADASGRPPAVAGLPERTDGQRIPVALETDATGREGFLRHLMHDIWNRRLLNRIAQVWTDDALVHTAPGRELVGAKGLLWWVIRMLAAIPDGAMTVEHYCDADETDGHFAALRWTFNGTHSGDGLFGPPSGRPVQIMGISHFRFDADDRIVEEWTLFDEIAVLRQIYAKNALAV